MPAALLAIFLEKEIGYSICIQKMQLALRVKK